MKLTLDKEEIGVSGKEPRNEVPAPLVDGRDFVTERLVLDEMVAVNRLSSARARYQRYDALVDAGVIRSDELAEARLALREAESQLELMELKLVSLQGGTP